MEITGDDIKLYIMPIACVIMGRHKYQLNYQPLN